jgi:hypothetical protein
MPSVQGECDRMVAVVAATAAERHPLTQYPPELWVAGALRKVQQRCDQHADQTTRLSLFCAWTSYFRRNGTKRSDFRYWHKTDMSLQSPHVGCWGMNGRRSDIA